MKQITLDQTIAALQEIAKNYGGEMPLVVLDEDNILYSVCDVSCMGNDNDGKDEVEFSAISVSPISLLSRTITKNKEIVIKNIPDRNVKKDMSQYELAVQAVTGFSDGDSKAILKLLQYHGYDVFSNQDKIMLEQSIVSNAALRAKLAELNELVLDQQIKIRQLIKKNS